MNGREMNPWTIDAVAETGGDPIGFGLATGRCLGKRISDLILGISYFVALFTAKKQALHDLIASTMVIGDLPEGKQYA